MGYFSDDTEIILQTTVSTGISKATHDLFSALNIAAVIAEGGVYGVSASER